MFNKNYGYIAFRTIPNTLKRNGKVKLLQLELSGIQRYIFGDINICTPIYVVSARSQYIKDITALSLAQIKNKLGEKSVTEELNNSSGKLILALDRSLKDSSIKEALDELQRIIFASSQAKLQMFYAICDAKITDNVENLARCNASKLLIEKLEKNKYHCTNILDYDTNKYDYALFRIKQCTYDPKETDQKSARMAIKFDLDNLGLFFGSMQQFDVRNAASQALSSVLLSSLENIPDVQKIFIGGDDIFATASVDTYLNVISKMYNNIRKGIMTKPELESYRAYFGISGGASIIRNDLGKESLLVLYHASENELLTAKSAKGKNVISINNAVVSWEQFLVLTEIVEKNKNKLFSNIDNNAKMILMEDVLRLTARVLSMKRQITMTKEQERLLKEIG